MSLTTEHREKVVTRAIREISHIATLPEITLKIIDLVENPDSTAQDLHEVISGDPALCSRILKVVNSSFYGLPGQIGSINRAIMMLGLNAVKNIAIAASLAKLFRGGELTPNFSARDLWQHSNAVAAAAKMIADRRGFAFADEAYLAGLMHDIGIMVEMQFDRAGLIEVIEQVGVDAHGNPKGNMLEVEEHTFEANHQDFGRALCERWKFPSAFASVAGHHHAPDQAPSEHEILTRVIAVADRLAGQVGLGFRLDLASVDIDAGLCDPLGLTQADVEALVEQLHAVADDLDGTLH